MKDDYFLKKLESSHQAIAETVSAYGAEVKKNNDEIIDLKRLVKDFTVYSKEMIKSHDDSIKALDEAKTTIFTSVKALWIFVPVVIGLAGFGIKQWANNFESRVKTLETERKQAYEQFIKILGDKKNYLNQETVQNIFANI